MLYESDGPGTKAGRKARTHGLRKGEHNFREEPSPSDGVPLNLKPGKGSLKPGRGPVKSDLAPNRGLKKTLWSEMVHQALITLSD